MHSDPFIGDPLPIAVIGIVLRGDTVLVVKRSKSVIAPGLVCFPGGGLEDGESEEDGLRRELAEELSLPVQPVKRIWQSTAPWKVDLRWWLCLADKEQIPQPNPKEVESWWWEAWSSLAARDDLLASNRQFLTALDRGEISLDGGSI